ncbi:hypothetical protein LSAT2_009542 [Lamellibrachia satsuma]|nr:hypothetical protein LSAT2_009542 [Lamellibrachia satsuma]
MDSILGSHSFEMTWTQKLQIDFVVMGLIVVFLLLLISCPVGVWKIGSSYCRTSETLPTTLSERRVKFASTAEVRVFTPDPSEIPKRRRRYGKRPQRYTVLQWAGQVFVFTLCGGPQPPPRPRNGLKKFVAAVRRTLLGRVTICVSDLATLTSRKNGSQTAPSSSVRSSTAIFLTVEERVHDRLRVDLAAASSLVVDVFLQRFRHDPVQVATRSTSGWPEYSNSLFGRPVRFPNSPDVVHSLLVGRVGGDRRLKG